MKKNLPIIVLGLLVLLALSSFIAVKFSPNILIKTPAPAIQNQAKSTSTELIFFYGNGCPHCAKVEQFFTDNKVQEKIKFTEDEVFSNKDNSALLAAKAAACGLDTANIGVPFLWEGSTGKCYMGDEDVTNYFKSKLGIQ